MITEMKIIFITLFYKFLKNYSTSANNIFREAFYHRYLQTVKFNVNLWTLCFLSNKKYLDPLRAVKGFAFLSYIFKTQKAEQKVHTVVKKAK